MSKGEPKRAVITGITGQDGSYLAELLLDKGYRVFGFARQESWFRSAVFAQLGTRIEMLFGDLVVAEDISSAVEEAKPDEIYNLASQSRPGESWAHPTETMMINGLGPVLLFDAVRRVRPRCRVFHASSSEMFGRTTSWPQNEHTPFDAANPYAAAKVYAHQMARIYRQSYGMFISCGILFNHESERRPVHFLSQKVAYGAACAALGILDSPGLNERGRPIVQGGKLFLGMFEVFRDWGYAPDFVEAMWRMLQQDNPEDFVIGTGQLHSLRDLCAVAYGSVGLDWNDFVASDPALVRPLESGRTLADSSLAHARLGWKPSVNFESMVSKMVDVQKQRLMKIQNTLPGSL
ncbi:MAG: GDP-mannose 4,6-dehydratase [Ferrovum myxofaciens]